MMLLRILSAILISPIEESTLTTRFVLLLLFLYFIFMGEPDIFDVVHANVMQGMQEPRK